MFITRNIDGWLGLLLAGAAVGFAASSNAQVEGQPQAALVRTEIVYPTGERATSMLLLERFTPRQVRAGEEFAYEIRLTNLTRVDLRDIVLVEQFPPNFAAESSRPRARASSRAERQATWSWRTLRAGATETISVRGATVAPGELDFCATISFSTVTCARTDVVQPKLELTKTLTPDVLVCDPITAKYAVRNSGTGALRGVRITDKLPKGLSTVDGYEDFTIDVGELAAGQARSFAVELRAAWAGEFANTAFVEEEGGLRAEASARVRVRQPVLAVTKRGPELRYVGRPAEFEISVQNTGDGPAHDVILTDLIPAGAEVVATGGGQVVDRTVTWNLGTLAPQAARTVTLVLRPNELGTLHNTATANAHCAAATARASLKVAGVPAILLEVVDDPDPIEVGGNVTYMIEVTNQGSAVSTNIVIDCTLPEELRFVSATGPAASAVAGQNIRFAPLQVLPPKATVAYRVVASGEREADARFRVVMKSDQTTSPVEESESTHIY